MLGELRVGIVGCGENTHGRAWAEMLGGQTGEELGMRPGAVWDADRAAAEVVAATSGARVADRFEDVANGVHGVLITEVYPDRYLELARPFLQSGMRVFINRPFAASMDDAREIVRLSREYGAAIYSASALFHTEAGAKAREALASLGEIRLFASTGPTDFLTWYLPHAIAGLVSVLGTGIASVRALSLSPREDDPHRAAAPVLIHAAYGPGAAHGRAEGIIQMVGPGANWYGFTLKLFGTERDSDEIRFEVSYEPLLRTMARFFRTGEEPIPPAVILEKTAIFHASLESARRGGAAVRLEEM